LEVNINATFKISINSGAALVLWLVAFFGVLFVSKLVPAVASSLILTLAALTTGFGGYLKKRDANNAKALEAEKLGLNCDPGKGAANA
jgi:hypothetical protein